jgi:tRNA (cmo5U34)-methyltransferase
MQPEELKTLFDQQAASYDQQWAKLAPIRDAQNLLMASIFSSLPNTARLLCVGAGTGAELIYLAEKFPHWHFTAVEPSGPMLEVCRRRAEAHGFANRCSFHEGYLDSLPPTDAFDAATCLLVSQFLVERPARIQFFQTIAQRLRPDGILVSSDLSYDLQSDKYPSLSEAWLKVMAGAEVPAEAIKRMRSAYGRDVALLPAAEVEAILAAAGFDSPVQFFQAGLIGAWYSKRSA